MLVLKRKQSLTDFYSFISWSEKAGSIVGAIILLLAFGAFRSPGYRFLYSLSRSSFHHRQHGMGTTREMTSDLDEGNPHAHDLPFLNGGLFADEVSESKPTRVFDDDENFAFGTK